MDGRGEGGGAPPSSQKYGTEFGGASSSSSSKKDGTSETSLMLSDRIPPEFLDPRYDPVLFDLRYFDSPNDFEAKIDGNAGLEELEDQLRESCSVFMQRFFLLANGIVVYHQELLKYLNDLQEGLYVNSTVKRVMEDEEGLQLLTESLALFGTLILLMEHRMNGSLREKLLVAHLRKDRCFDAPNLEAVCLLCRVHPSGSLRQLQSSRSSSVRVLVQKSEELFMRFPFPKQVLDSLIGRLKDCICTTASFITLILSTAPWHWQLRLDICTHCYFICQRCFIMSWSCEKFLIDSFMSPWLFPYLCILPWICHCLGMRIKERKYHYLRVYWHHLSVIRASFIARRSKI